MVNCNSRYPWTENQWQQVLQQYRSNRLPHALLLCGPEGTGKLDFARQLTETLLCDKNRVENFSSIDNWQISKPCGQCNGCQLLAAGTHPDSFIIQPEAEGKQIQIASIREINQYVSLTSQFAPLQIVIIAPAEAMNRNAANALLKTLEEPRPGKLIILCSSQPSRLLPTVKSRCQMLYFSLPDTDQALAWMGAQNAQVQDVSAHRRLLALASGAPLLALQYAQQGRLELYQQLLQSFENIGKKQADPVAEAKRWETAGLAYCVKWLYLWVSSLIYLKSGEAVVDTSKVESYTAIKGAVWREPSLDFLIDRTSSANLFAYLDQLTETSRIVNAPVNVQLTLENLLLSWRQKLE